MDQFDFETLAIASVSSLACSLPGCFLFLQNKTMQVEAISHGVLLGIVLVFLAGFSTSPLLLFLGCTCFGILTVSIGEFLSSKTYLFKNTGISLVFPGFFAVAVILINVYLKNTHIDLHIVLLGELATAAFERIDFNGRDFGPLMLWKALSALFGVVVFLFVFGKKLAFLTFDSVFFKTQGYFSKRLRVLFLAVVCLCALTAFDVMGSVASLALFSIPPSAAFFWSSRFRIFFWIAGAVSVIGTSMGVFVAQSFNLSMSGCICLSLGFALLVSVFAGPSKGVFWIKRKVVLDYE